MSQSTVESRLQPSRPGPRRTGRTARPASAAFGIVIAGSSISMLGTKISTLAFPMLILWLSGSPALAGLAIFATVIPGVLLNVPAGIIVDKTDPWRVMIISEFFRGVTAVSIVISILLYGRAVNILLLMTAMFAEEALEMCSTLAERRCLNSMMDQGETTERRSQQASIEARTHAAVLAGRPIAPFLFTLNPFGPFLADAFSFAFSITGLLLGGKRKQREPGHPATANRTPVDQRSDSPQPTPGILDALRSMREDPTIWLGGTLLSMTSVVSQALILIFLAEANSHRFSALAIGAVLAASGLGGAVGSYWSKSLPQFLRKRWITVQLTAWLISCAGLALTGGHSAWAAGCTMFVFSFTGSIGNVEFSTYLNINIRDDMLGKVSGVFYALSIGGSAIGPVIGGCFIQQFSVRATAFTLLGAVILMTACSLFVPPKNTADSNLPPAPDSRPNETAPPASRPFVEEPPTAGISLAT